MASASSRRAHARVAALSGLLGLLPGACAQGQQPLQRTFDHSGMRIDVRYASIEAARKHAEIEDILRRGITSCVALFGGLPRDTSGRPYTELRAELSVATRGEGNADQGVIQVALGSEPMFGFYTWQMTLLHELFHLWAAETFNYRTTEESWFSEGFAEFYTLQTAARLGLITADRVPATFAIPVAFYTTAKGLGRISMRSAGSTLASKQEHYFLIYHGGLTAALVLDYQIRRATQQRSLDDLMRWLYRNFDARERRYALPDIERGLRETTGLDFHEFMANYVAGTQVIPVGSLFNLGDLALELARNTVPHRKARPLSDPALLKSLGM